MPPSAQIARSTIFPGLIPVSIRRYVARSLVTFSPEYRRSAFSSCIGPGNP